MLNFHLITLFPEFFHSPLATSLLGRARSNGLISFSFHNPRDFGMGAHRQVDDRPFGGGPGMIMQLEPILKAVGTIENPGPLLLLSPSGKQFDQSIARELVKYRDLTLICGRYEGIDSRLNQLLPLHDISVCPAILNGGETAALAIIEAVARLTPGFLGKNESAEIESFTDNLFEYPQYTRPEFFQDLKVPDILLSGNHAEIAKWRRQKALSITLARNPDLLSSAMLSKTDADFLSKQTRKRPSRNLSFCLCHSPVVLENGKIGCSSLTNLDVHDIGRISRSYGMGPFFVLHPLNDQRQILNTILEHWQMREKGHADRKKALDLARPVHDFEEIKDWCDMYYGQAPCWIISSANWPEKVAPVASVKEIREMCEERPVIICLGTARGLAVHQLPFNFLRMRPIRFLDENHLSVRAAAAIIADRILGDFF